MQKRPGLGFRGYWPSFPSISVLNTSLCRVWSKTVQNRNPIPVQIRFLMPGPFYMGGPFCTVGSCRTVRVWVFVYNLDCAFQNRDLNTSFHRTRSKPVQNSNVSPVLLRFDMPGPFCTAYIIKCIAMQKRPGLGFRGYWPSFPSISVLNTSLCRVWSKTVQSRNPIPVQIRFLMPGPFYMGGPFCTVGSCRTVRVWVFVYNLDCDFQNRS